MWRKSILLLFPLLIIVEKKVEIKMFLNTTLMNYIQTSQRFSMEDSWQSIDIISCRFNVSYVPALASLNPTETERESLGLLFSFTFPLSHPGRCLHFLSFLQNEWFSVRLHCVTTTTEPQRISASFIKITGREGRDASAACKFFTVAGWSKFLSGKIDCTKIN